MTVMVPRNKMLLAANRKIRCLSDKALNSNLSYFADSLADAFTIDAAPKPSAGETDR